MKRPTSALIEEMAAELRPVKSLNMRDGLLMVAGAALLSAVGVELLAGLWRGIWNGEASSFFILTNGLLLVLGCAATTSVLRMASPRVGNQHEGPRWASLGVAVLPFAALMTLIGDEHGDAGLDTLHGMMCMGSAMAASSLTAFVLFLWLRRGAVVAPATAGLHLGVASTALGSAAYGLACPLDGAVHLGLWHVLPVVLGAVIGRYLMAPLLRW